MKNFIINIILTFLTGLFAIYILSGKVGGDGLIVSFISAGVVALGYWVVYLIKKMRK
ncbi:hypothetical protein D3C74_88170 [compost metagenome]